MSVSHRKVQSADGKYAEGILVQLKNHCIISLGITFINVLLLLKAWQNVKLFSTLLQFIAGKEP